MPLTVCIDLDATDWLTASTLPWGELVTFGPAGFPAYARLRFIPDPEYAGQSESDVAAIPNLPHEQVRVQTALAALAAHTTTPDDCYIAYWEGWGEHAFPAEVWAAPRLSLPHRDYIVLRGTAADLVGGSGSWPDPPHRSVPGRQAFVWPADHAWCVTADVDPHFACIGAGRDAIAELVTSTDLDIVPIEPGSVVPYYR